MRSEKLFVCLLAGLVLIVFASCQDEKKDDDFSGVGRLISSRNKARYDEAENTVEEKKYTSKRKTTYKKGVKQTGTESEKKGLSTIVLYEEEVKILASQSGKTLANGVAYINKKGEIIKIKILKQ
ncbi:MAG: hypothetical protein GY857_12655 [Desulfobacula sp.]|nr:hypothetical protein [Desulfobacula sp.]